MGFTCQKLWADGVSQLSKLDWKLICYELLLVRVDEKKMVLFVL